MGSNAQQPAPSIGLPSDYWRPGRDPERVRTVEVPSPQTARRMAESVVIAAQRLYAEYGKAKALEARDREKLNQLRRDEDDLRLAKDRAIQEVDRGLFCNQCWETAEEIAKKEPFLVHLLRVKGEAISAKDKATMLAKIDKDFAPALERSDSDRKTVLRHLDQVRIALANMRSEAPVGLDLWRHAVNLEAELTAVALQQNRENAEREVARTTARLQEIRRDLDLRNAGKVAGQRAAGDLNDLLTFAERDLANARGALQITDNNVIQAGADLKRDRAREYQVMKNAVVLEGPSFLPNIEIEPGVVTTITTTKGEQKVRVAPWYVPSSVTMGQQYGGESAEVVWTVDTTKIKALEKYGIEPKVGIETWAKPQVGDRDVALFVEFAKGARLSILHYKTATETGADSGIRMHIGDKAISPKQDPLDWKPQSGGHEIDRPALK